MNSIAATHSSLHPRARIVWATVMLLCLLPISANLGVGLGENIDSFLISLNAQRFQAEGAYFRSRSWGYPFYEWAAYPLLAYLRPIWAQLYSLLWVLASYAIVYFSLRLEKLSCARVALGVLAFAWMPSTIISGNTVLETAQSTALGLLTVHLLQRFLAKGRDIDALGAFVAAGIAVATRPCHVIELGALSLTLFLFKRLPFWKLAAFALLGAAIALTPYWLFYGEAPWDAGLQIIETGDPAAMRLIKTGIGFAAVLGLPAWGLLIGYGIFATQRRPRGDLPAPGSRAFFVEPKLFFFLVVTLLYAVRMLLLPDEIEYIYFWAAFFLLFAIPKISTTRQLALLVVAIGLPNLVQLHLFDRQANGEIRWSLGLSPGVIAQERERRELHEYLTTAFPEIAKAQWIAHGCSAKDLSPTQFFNEHFPYATGGSPCVLASVKWFARMRDYVFPSQGRTMATFLQRYPKTILVHSIPTDRGWRRFLKFVPAYPLRPEFLQFKTHHVGEPPQDACFWTGEGCRG